MNLTTSFFRYFNYIFGFSTALLPESSGQVVLALLSYLHTFMSNTKCVNRTLVLKCRAFCADLMFSAVYLPSVSKAKYRLCFWIAIQ